MTKVKILFNLLSQDLISEYEKKGHCIILFRFRNSLRPTLINADAKQMDIIFADKVGIVLCKLGLLESIYVIIFNIFIFTTKSFERGDKKSTKFFLLISNQKSEGPHPSEKTQK